MFFVTFHGGTPTKQIPDPINNVLAYDDDGNPKGSTSGVLDPGKNTTLDELRGIYLVPNTGLYVINGSKDTSNILLFTGSDTSYGSPSVFASAQTTSAINHPFAAAFDGATGWYVSNQDTNVVATLTGSGAGPASATSLGAYLDALYAGGTFLTGTLIASSIGNLPNISATTAVPKELGGLDALVGDSSDDAASPADKSSKSKPKTQHSVRDVQYYSYTFNGQTIAILFVVDEASALVRIYDPTTGQPLRNSNPLPASPTHLLINQGTLYVGVGKQVFSSPIPNPYDPAAPMWVFTPIASIGTLAGDVSDMAFDSGGNFHVAIRTTNEVLKFDSSFSNPTPWPAKMTDNPEFLLYVPD
jgi:hypothetical protein